MIQRRRATALGLLLALATVVALLASGAGTRRHATPAASPVTGPATTPTRASRPPSTSSLATSTTPGAAQPSPRSYSVGELTLPLIDGTRSIRLPGRRAAPRSLPTTVLYPAPGTPDGTIHPNAAPDHAAGPFPLVVFAHGLGAEPATYARLLAAWAAAGYVVAAPLLPLTRAGAPGGPTARDLPNQPADVSFVISGVLAADLAAPSPLYGLVAREIAVAGQGTGGDTALAVGYDPRFHDPRVRAAMILSGAEIPTLSRFRIALGGPTLLAAQGLADAVNRPAATRAFYDPAPRPKYLLELFGAGDLGPYTHRQPQLRIVARVTTAFLDRNLKHLPGARGRMFSTGDVANLSTLFSGR